MRRNHTDAAEQRPRRALAAVLAALVSTGCFYGYNTDVSVTPLTDTQYGPTADAALYFRALTAQDTCTPIALVEVAGGDDDTTADGLVTLRQRAAQIGADAVFGVNASRTAREGGEALGELLAPEKHHRRVYSSHVVSGLAVRCTAGARVRDAPVQATK